MHHTVISDRRLQLQRAAVTDLQFGVGWMMNYRMVGAHWEIDGFLRCASLDCPKTLSQSPILQHILPRPPAWCLINDILTTPPLRTPRFILQLFDISDVSSQDVPYLHSAPVDIECILGRNGAGVYGRLRWRNDFVHVHWLRNELQRSDRYFKCLLQAPS